MGCGASKEEEEGTQDRDQSDVQVKEKTDNSENQSAEGRTAAPRNTDGESAKTEGEAAVGRQESAQCEASSVIDANPKEDRVSAVLRTSEWCAKSLNCPVFLKRWTTFKRANTDASVSKRLSLSGDDVVVTPECSQNPKLIAAEWKAVVDAGMADIASGEGKSVESVLDDFATTHLQGIKELGYDLSQAATYMLRELLTRFRRCDVGPAPFSVNAEVMEGNCMLKVVDPKLTVTVARHCLQLATHWLRHPPEFLSVSELDELVVLTIFHDVFYYDDFNNHDIRLANMFHPYLRHDLPARVVAGHLEIAPDREKLAARAFDNAEDALRHEWAQMDWYLTLVNTQEFEAVGMQITLPLEFFHHLIGRVLTRTQEGFAGVVTPTHGHIVPESAGTARFKILYDTVLGVGGFGTVYKGFERATGTPLAVKESQFQNVQTLESLKREYALLKTLSHKNIVRVFDLQLSARQGENVCQIFVEWMSQGSVLSVIETSKFRLHEQLIRRYFAAALEGLAYLHEQGVLHRDIKPGNMLVNPEGTLKLADFGTSSRPSSSGAAESVVGTPAYLSPGAIRGHFSHSSDIWALACSVIQMATAEVPWSHLPSPLWVSSASLMYHIGTASPPNHHPLIPAHLSAELRGILTQMFSVVEETPNPLVGVPDEKVSAKGLSANPYFTATSLPPGSETLTEYAASRKQTLAASTFSIDGSPLGQWGAASGDGGVASIPSARGYSSSATCQTGDLPTLSI